MVSKRKIVYHRRCLSLAHETLLVGGGPRWYREQTKMSKAGRGTCTRSRGSCFLPTISVLVGVGIDWMLRFVSALGMPPGGALLAPALLLLLLLSSPGKTQSVNFSAPAANDTMLAVGSNPALQVGDPEMECPRCDAMFGMLSRTELGTNVQNISVQVRWVQIATFSL